MSNYPCKDCMIKNVCIECCYKAKSILIQNQIECRFCGQQKMPTEDCDICLEVDKIDNNYIRYMLTKTKYKFRNGCLFYDGT